MANVVPMPSTRRVWQPEQLLLLSAAECSHCEGHGCDPSAFPIKPCKCVLRSIFRRVMGRYVESEHSHKSSSVFKLRSGCYGRPVEEFRADVILLTKAVLSAVEWKVFVLHVLVGKDHHDCCKFLKIAKGQFFHSVYRIQEKLGRAFSETLPYALYPIGDYMEDTIGTTKQCSRSVSQLAHVPLRPPMLTPRRIAA